MCVSKYRKISTILTNREYHNLLYRFMLYIFEERLFHEVCEKSDWTIWTERIILITLSKTFASWYRKERNLID